jgi:protein-disulfide isomerase
MKENEVSEIVSRWLLAVAFVGLLAAALLLTPSTPGGAAKTPPTDEVTNVVLSLDGSPVMGDSKAPVGIVEFSDYGCPFCAMHAKQTLPQIIADYVKTGKVRYFFKDLPVETSHPHAFKEAEAARCAGAQGQYWAMHDRLFKNQRPQIVDELKEQALQLKLDVPRFVECVDKHTYQAPIRNDIAEARQIRVKGTPTFFVGKLDPNESRMQAAAMIYGSQGYAAFQAVLDRILTNGR